MDDYGNLRKLLLNKEEKEIAYLQTALESLLEETRNPEEIIKKLVPLISKIFSLTLKENKAEFVGIFSPVIGELLQDTIKNSSAEIAVIMAPIMGKAIKEVVKNERDEIVDALYPVLGNMISKYVAETFKEVMLEINQKVQHTFSFEVFNRKITAKIKGISETELLLQSSSNPYIIQSVFLIHKETGILISERSISGGESIEPEMVASMLTAIRSFVNDWISKNSDHFELNEIEFGNSTIRLEVAGCCYLAIVLKGSINRKGQQSIVHVLENLVENHAQNITEFDGNTQTLPIEEINSQLDTLIKYESDGKVLKKRKSWVLWAIFILVIGSGFFYLYQMNLSNNAEEKAYLTLYNDPYLNLYNINIDVVGSKVIIKGRLPVKSLHKRLVDNISKALPKFTIQDQVVLTHTLPTYEESFTILQAIVKSVNNVQGNQVEFTFNKGVVEITGLIHDHSAYEELINDLSSVSGIIHVISTLKEHPIGEATELFYEVGESTISDDNKALLDYWIQVNSVVSLLKLHDDMDLLVIGYTDIQGYAKNNALISNKRAENVLEYLTSKGIALERLSSIGVPAPPKKNLNDALGRCIQIKWVKR